MINISSVQQSSQSSLNIEVVDREKEIKQKIIYMYSHIIINIQSRFNVAADMT